MGNVVLLSEIGRPRNRAAILDLSARFLRYRGTCYDVLGYNDRLAGVSCIDITVEVDKAKCREIWSQLVYGTLRRVALSKNFHHADGHIVPTALTATAIPDRLGKTEYVAIQFTTSSHVPSPAHRLVNRMLARYGCEPIPEDTRTG